LPEWGSNSQPFVVLKVAFNTINQQTIDFYALKQTSFSPIKRLLDRTEFVKAQIGVHFVEHHMN
jgi:hypothetical protein